MFQFFGYLAMGVFGYQTYIKYGGWKRGDTAQGRTSTATTVDTSTSTFPTY